MVKLKNLQDKNNIPIKEIEHFKKLVKGHEKILKAIGKL